MDQGGQITMLLQKAADGDRDALEQAVGLVHGDLERIARKHVRRAYGARSEEVTLEPSALVNETFLKLVKQRNPYRNREQFFAVATRVMLRALIDYERSRHAQRRGGEMIRVTLTGIKGPDGPTLTTAVALADSLEKLEQLDRRKADVVKLRELWGFTMEEIAEMLDVSLRSVNRDWQFARAWLSAQLKTA